jgi:lambda family phage portal protein
MGLFDRFRKSRDVTRTPNPHSGNRVQTRSGGFFSTDTDRLLSGWDTSSKHIDEYLDAELEKLRARSRRMIRNNPFGKKFVSTLRSNVIGPVGVQVQAQTLRGQNLDSAANEALEQAFKLWSERYADVNGTHSFLDFQNMAISCAGQDGEFLFRKSYTGPHGFQLRILDVERIDSKKNHATTGGGEIRLGVEYDRGGRRIRYHFRTSKGEPYSVRAEEIIHGFVPEWPEQSRGIPWMHASLERTKHLEKYEEAAIIKARSTASTMAVLSSNPGDEFTGDEQDPNNPGQTLQEYEPGTIQDIGNRTIHNIDSDYPHEMYASFVKTQLQSIASGLGISYASLSSDLEGVNYSSIRTGVLEDREIFKGLQNWFIRSLIVKVYEEWVTHAVARGVVRINGTGKLSRPIDDYLRAHYQGRRWAWVDPQKDAASQQMAIAADLKSRSAIIRELGEDPETVWREIQREREFMAQLGIDPQSFYNTETVTNVETENEN